MDFGMLWARCQDAAEIWHAADDKYAPNFRGTFWLRVKASICIALGRVGGLWSSGRTFEDIPVWSSLGSCHESYDGPEYHWREVSVYPGLRHWRAYSYTNGF